MKIFCWFVALCCQTVPNTAFAQGKVALIADQVSLASMATIHERLIAERAVTREEVVLFRVENGFNAESEVALQLKRLAPQIVIVPEPKMLELFTELNLAAKVVLITHGPWVSSSDETTLSKVPLKVVRVSTFLDADAACMTWLVKVVPSVRYIGVVAGKNSNVGYIRKLEYESKLKGLILTSFLVDSPDEAVALVANSKVHRIDAWYFPHTRIVWGGIGKIVETAKKLKVPTAFEYSHVYSRLGGLMSCSSQFDLDQRVVDAVRYLFATDNITHPIYFRPTNMSLAINLDTAKAIRLDLPQKLIRRFDFRFALSEIVQSEPVPLADNKQRR